jgi:hypothetical protein
MLRIHAALVYFFVAPIMASPAESESMQAIPIWPVKYEVGYLQGPETPGSSFGCLGYRPSDGACAGGVDQFFGGKCLNEANETSPQMVWVKTLHGHLAPLAQNGDNQTVKVLGAGELVQDDPERHSQMYRRMRLQDFYWKKSENGTNEFYPYQRFEFTGILNQPPGPDGDHRVYVKEWSNNRCLRPHESFPGWSGPGDTPVVPEEPRANFVDCTAFGNGSDARDHILWRWRLLENKKQPKLDWAEKMVDCKKCKSRY